MAETKNTTISGETVQTMGGSPDLSQGSVGLESQLPGSATTVSQGAEATGGIGAGNLFASDIDEQLFRFNSDDTPLMNLMLSAKHVRVDSPEVEHYQIDEPRASVKTNQACGGGDDDAVALPLANKDKRIPVEYGTLLVKGVNGYTEDGQTETPGKDLMLFVTGRDASGMPIVRAVNGPKTRATDEVCKIPSIPANSTIVLLANALYETQKEVKPDMIIPQPSLVYLQKRGMNQIVSDYFDSQKKRIPFSKAIIAEQAIANFKVRCNRSLWAGRKGKFKVDTELGMQDVYFSEGVRWQFKRELQHTGPWTVEKIIALAKMFFTGEDVPKTAILLAGKNLLEKVQCIDYSNHPEIQITTKTTPVGWTVTNFHTVFGDIQIKREPTLDRLGWSNSGALLGENRLVHYVRSEEHSFEERVEGHEATRSGLLKWDALALKGSCHIWIDGEGSATNAGAVRLIMWEGNTAPTGNDLVDKAVYYLMNDCPGINANAMSGQTWQASVNGNTVTWSPFVGEYYAN